MDRITLRNIRAHGHHGANPGERDREQPFDIDVILELDLSPAEASDELSATVDYAELHKRIIHIVESTSCVLLEKLAGKLLFVIFTDPRIARAEVSIAKPEILSGATPTVTLTRENPRHHAQFS